MTKTLCVMLVFLSFNVFGQEDMSKTEEEHALRVNKACDLKMRFDLHDFEYGRDEKREFSNLHFEDTSLLAGLMAKACEWNPVNRKKLERVGTIFVKRGGMDQRKLIQRKNGDLVYLAARVVAERGKGRDDLIQADLVKVLGLTYVKASDIAKKAAEEKAVVEKKKEEDVSAKKAAERDRKIAELTAWFQGEVKKAQALPPAEMGPAMERLSKEYEGKLNAVINTP